jgi:hypothetical protein
MRSSMQYDERRISSRALRLKTQFAGVEQLPSRQRVVPPRSIPPDHRAGSPRSALPKSPASQVPDCVPCTCAPATPAASPSTSTARAGL